MKCLHSLGSYLHNRPFSALPEKPYCLRFWSTTRQALKDHLGVYCLGNLHLFIQVHQQFQSIQFAQSNQRTRIADNNTIAVQFNSSARVCWLKGGSMPLA